MKVYYKGLFFKREVQILDRVKYWGYTNEKELTFFCQYLVKFKNGKEKYVYEDKLLFRNE